jgi:hypothetical protein
MDAAQSALFEAVRETGALLGQTIAPLQLLGCGVVVLAVVALGLRR